jgi:uncharacterized protein (DUF427 family)
MNPAPGFKKYPNHALTVQPARVRVRVQYKGELIAETTRAIEMHERSTTGKVAAPVVYYVPREDVQMQRLKRSDHHTHCPFKGDASYYSLSEGPENAVWSYEAPYDEMSAVRGLLAFYPDKFEITAS